MNARWGAAAAGGAHPAVARWLLACAALVFLVLVVGGITRLMHAGLSIVQWQPLTGMLPPLSQDDWTRLFEQYRASPEFRLLNADMGLEGFRAIFWWEYAHRLLGRLAGLCFLLPLLWFIRQRRLPPGLAPRLGAIFALGALQGALGWYMVASGLVDDPRVSPLRLSAHLGMALLLLGLLLWNGWALQTPGARRRAPPPAAAAAVLLVFIMALSGGLMAGSHAGLAYETFPLMNGDWVPAGLLRLSPWYDNLRDNLAAIQFLHRLLALAVTGAVLLLAWAAGRSHPAPAGRRARGRRAALPLALLLQLGLGIATLLSGVALPLAAAHQAGAVLLYAATLRTAFGLTRAGGA